MSLKLFHLLLATGLITKINLHHNPPGVMLGLIREEQDNTPWSCKSYQHVLVGNGGSVTYWILKKLEQGSCHIKFG